MLSGYHGSPPLLIAPLAGLETNLARRLPFSVGSHIHRRQPRALARAAKLAATSDVVVLGLGLCGNNYGVDSDAVCDGRVDEAESHDRSSIALPPAQLELARHVVDALAARPSTAQLIVFIMAAGSVDVLPLLKMCDEVAPHVKLALLWAGYPGEFGGQGIADVITGTHDPASVLPFTLYPESLASQVRFTDFSLRSWPGRTYKFFSLAAVFPFGHGLSYGRFDVSWAVAPPREAGPGEALEYKVLVTNTGATKGDKVLLAYFVPARDDGAAPLRQVFAFRRAREIAPGASVVVQLQLAEQGRTLWRENGTPYVPSGGHSVMIGQGVEALIAPLNIQSGHIL